jgi:hypothetical protein
MAKIQIIFYSMYGHVYQLAKAVAEGAREVPDTQVSLYQVPELVPDDALEKSGAKAAREAFADIPVAEPAQLAEADAIIFGTWTRRANCGLKALWPVRSAVFLPAPVLSTEARKRRLQAFIRHCCITA